MLSQKKIPVAIVILLFSSLKAFSQNLSIPSGPPRAPVVTGQVTIADGTKIGESIQIQIVCGGRVRTEFYTDMQGRFDFDLSRLEGTLTPRSAEVSATTPSMNYESTWNDCLARAVLAGFSSDSIEFARYFHELGVVAVGSIRLHPVNPGAKTSLSVSSLLAPKPARKAMEKGQKLEEQKKWPQAEEFFRQAVEAYPEYAAAWSELGKVQYVQQNFPSARKSFQQAIAIDPQYVKPYLGLAQLATEAHDWPELVRMTDKALALDSVSYPAAWLLNAAAQYNLHNYDAAEASVRNGKRADTDHSIDEFHTLWMRIVSARNASATFAGQSPRIRFGTRRIWENNDPSSVWLR